MIRQSARHSAVISSLGTWRGTEWARPRASSGERDRTRIAQWSRGHLSAVEDFVTRPCWSVLVQLRGLHGDQGLQPVKSMIRGYLLGQWTTAATHISGTQELHQRRRNNSVSPASGLCATTPPSRLRAGPDTVRHPLVRESRAALRPCRSETV